MASPIQLPYLTYPGSLDKALPKIKAAAKPERFTGDFVSTVVQLKGGTGKALIPFFKKIGFLNADGTPSDIHERFRNRASAGAAMAEAIRHGYKPLYKVNEYAHKLSDNDLKGAIVQVTGLEPANNTVNYILRTFKRLTAEANFEGQPETESGPKSRRPPCEGGKRTKCTQVRSIKPEPVIHN